MIPCTAQLEAAWLPLGALCVLQYEPRNLERVAFYLDLLRRYPGQHVGPPIAVTPFDGRYEILDGHHRYLAHILAGRTHAPCVIIREGE